MLQLDNTAHVGQTVTLHLFEAMGENACTWSRWSREDQKLPALGLDFGPADLSKLVGRCSSLPRQNHSQPKAARLPKLESVAHL